MRLDPVAETVRELVRKHPSSPTRTLARRLVAETNGALTIDQARNRIARAFGVHGAKDRRKLANKSSYRKRRAAGAVPPLPPSKAQPWLPYVFPAHGKIAILSDLHVPYHHPVALQAAIDYAAKQRIDGLLLNGDIADFYSISHWQKRPKMRDFPAELEAVRQLLSGLRARFPTVPIVYKCGNHEERWRSWLYQHAAEISDEPEMGLDVWLRTAALDITIIEDQRIVMVGQLPVLHGHELPRGLSSPVNPARGAFLRTKHSVLIGHQHQTSGHCEPNMFHAETFVWSTGCLCNLNPEFSRLNRWNLGFAIVSTTANGDYEVDNLRVTQRGEVRQS